MGLSISYEKPNNHDNRSDNCDYDNKVISGKTSNFLPTIYSIGSYYPPIS
jgi:hypothetical protein